MTLTMSIQNKIALLASVCLAAVVAQEFGQGLSRQVMHLRDRADKSPAAAP